MGDLSVKASSEFEENVRKWISSPGERIDLWEATLTVDPEVAIAPLRKAEF
jgi:hypothetical protein